MAELPPDAEGTLPVPPAGSPPIGHERWCTDHVTMAADPSASLAEASWCRGTLWRGDPDTNSTSVSEVALQHHESFGVVLRVFADTDTFLTPAQASAMADALHRAAAVLKDLGQHTITPD